MTVSCDVHVDCHCPQVSNLASSWETCMHGKKQINHRGHAWQLTHGHSYVEFGMSRVHMAFCMTAVGFTCTAATIVGCTENPQAKRWQGKHIIE